MKRSGWRNTNGFANRNYRGLRRHYAPRDLFDFVVRWKTLADDLETMPDPAAPGTPEGHGLAIPLGDQVNLQDQVKKLIALLVKDAVDKEVIRDGSELVDAAIKHVGHVPTHSGDGLNRGWRVICGRWPTDFGTRRQPGKRTPLARQAQAPTHRPQRGPSADLRG